MRLKPEEIKTLKDSLYRLDNQAELYLFGSRVDDKKRGGDIDLLVISKELSRRDIRRIRLDFFESFGEQKMDIVLDQGEMIDPFVKIIFKEAIKL